MYAQINNLCTCVFNTKQFKLLKQCVPNYSYIVYNMSIYKITGMNRLIRMEFILQVSPLKLFLPPLQIRNSNAIMGEVLKKK